ncbi:kinesin-like protein KIF2C [Neoarius graeffei]|uniref:kinesin-like protein KIF2C n=1 Tax=Neoarius graeffei TaxID=443677 RepID=UPI00298D35BD|nr:kinesin-like protein KIF2C [Neoarius graeffei]
MDPESALLLVGLAVKISRSDGRVHSATVKSVSVAKATVNVEWNEKGATKGKEIDLSDICRLNADLIEYLQASKKAGPSAAPAPSPARPSKAEKKSELPTKSSKIPAPSELPRRMTTRQTCLFRPPTIPSAGLTPADEGSSQEQPSTTIPRPSGLSYARRQFAPLLPAIEAVSESEASKCAPAPTANQRQSRVPEVNKMASKRLSVSTKNPETQTKKGKYGDMNRPNKQFYQMVEEYRETVEKVPLSLSDPVELHRICVCVRKRPLNKKEMAKKEIDVVTIPGNGVLLFHEPKQKVDLTKYLENQSFHFDYSFDEEASNDLVYRFTAKPLVKTVFEGGRATCFAYGQTGSGKTHTMGGDFSGKAQNSSKGVYALAAQDVFTLLQQKKYADLCPYVTFFEIYNGKVFDLLNNKAKLRVLEDENQQVQVVGLQEMTVLSVEDVIKMIEKGSACRTSGQTFANANSSRSHAVLQVILRRHGLLHGKFSLVDLAGNERGTDVSSNDRQVMVETAEINRSLLALKECIRSLGQNSEHIPFRMSKLTQVLRDSFIGENSRTCMIAMISPGMASCDYTLNTLRYADRVKELNGSSKGAVQNTKLSESEEGSSSLEEEGIPAALESMARISELEERFYEEMQASNEITQAMAHPLYDIVNGLPEIDAYMERLQGSYHALRSAIKALKARSPNLA